MGLCSFSTSFQAKSNTIVDNEFINEFLPSASGNAVKVYLYGLYLCSNPSSEDNDIASMATLLGMSEDEIFEHFSYFEELGLVQIINKTPFEIKFISPKKFSGKSKLREKGKYKDFNDQVQSILSGRMITPMEFNEYYNLIESHHFEPDALVMIVKYCTNLKSTSINYPYILAVARSFENDGIKSVDALEQKLLEQEKAGADAKEVLKALGLARDADLDERNMYLKWINSFGFTKNVILNLAKEHRKKGGMSKLDQTLTRLFEQKLFTLEEIERYSKEKEELLETAKKVTSTLGLYYQNLDSTIEVYIKDWTEKGYDKETLVKLALYCYKLDIRSLSLMNEVILKLFKKGLVSLEAIDQHINGVVEKDAAIQKILHSLGLIRKVNSVDRDLYDIWNEDWNTSEDIILLAAESAKGTANPMRYVNKILSEMHLKNITTLEGAKSYLTSRPTQNNKSAQNFSQREYSKEELNALFDSLDDIEV